MVARATAKKALVISGVVLVVSVSGAVLAFLIHYIYFDVHDVSPINIVIVPDEENALNTTITKITHNGKEAISNLHFTLRTPREITSWSYFNSVKDMTLEKIHPNVLTGTVLKFEAGRGSVIEIYTFTSSRAKTIYDGGYSAHAVYDQGSVKRELERKLAPLPWWEETSHQFHTLDVTVRKSILVGSIIIVLSFVAWLTTHFFDSLRGIYRDTRRKLK